MAKPASYLVRITYRFPCGEVGHSTDIVTLVEVMHRIAQHIYDPEMIVLAVDVSRIPDDNG
jgi:hypothetical protein